VLPESDAIEESFDDPAAVPGAPGALTVTNDDGDIVLSEEPEVTSFMRLRNLLLGRFVPEQLL